MKKHVQTDSEWQEEMSHKIIDEIQKRAIHFFMYDS